MSRIGFRAAFPSELFKILDPKKSNFPALLSLSVPISWHRDTNSCAAFSSDNLKRLKTYDRELKIEKEKGLANNFLRRHMLFSVSKLNPNVPDRLRADGLFLRVELEVSLEHDRGLVGS